MCQILLKIIKKNKYDIPKAEKKQDICGEFIILVFLSQNIFPIHKQCIFLIAVIDN